jgi:hypothetical protein
MTQGWIEQHLHNDRSYRDCLQIKGTARVRLFRFGSGRREPWYPKGLLKLEHEQFVGNLITDVGLDWIADQLATVPVLAALSHMELGTDGTPPQATNLTLGAPIAGSRLALTNPVTQASNEIVWSTFWDLMVATNPSISEAGDFNAAAAGDMIGRIAIGPFPKTDEHVLLIERTVTIIRGER